MNHPRGGVLDRSFAEVITLDEAGDRCQGATGWVRDIELDM